MVAINFADPNPRPGASSVVRGSLLGPTLFLMHINDAPNSKSQGVHFLFADDVKIVYRLKPD